MNTLQEYTELLSLTQLYILREHSPQEQVFVSPQFWKDFSPTQPINPKPKDSSSPNKQPPQTTTIQQPPKISPLPAPANLLVPPLEKLPVPIDLPIPKEELPNTESKPMKKEIGSFILEPVTHPPAQQFDEFIQITKAHHPHIPIREQIPSDAHAKKLKNAWLKSSQIPTVMILSFNDSEKHLTLLKNIANAITHNLAPARVLSAAKIEHEKKWDKILNAPELKLVIASDYGIYLLPGLMQHYKENAKLGKHLLHKTPLLLLSDLSLYLKEPVLKPLLWRAICADLTAASLS